MKCTNCDKVGHTVDTCFEIIGYPQGFKKNSNSGKQTFNANADVKMNSNYASSSSSPSGKASSFNGNVWFNINFSKFFFANSSLSINTITIGHPNGTLVTISHVRNLKLSNNAIFYNVLVVLSYFVSLLSVNKLIRDNKMFVGFDENKCYIQDLEMEKILGTGSESNGLYLSDMNKSNSIGQSNMVMTFHFSKVMWHNRLGHPANQVFKKDLNISDNSSVSLCEICQRAKQTKEPFPLSDHKSKTLGELVHLDFLNKSVEPACSSKAMSDPNWVEAMNNEIKALKRNNTCTFCDLPAGRKPIGSKWIWKIKYKASDDIEKYKARLLDINNAFLYGDLHEDFYMTLSDGYNVENKSKVCKLNKSLYGLKQALRQWNVKLTTAFAEHGFEQYKFDYSLYTKKNGDKFIALLVYVDDIVITGNNDVGIKEFKAKCPKNKRSVIGFCVFLGKTLVSWKSKKQPTISKSSSEAKYRSMSSPSCEVVWLGNLLHSIGLKDLYHVELFCDNSSAIQIAVNLVFHERIKHFKLDVHFVREKLEKIQGGKDMFKGKKKKAHPRDDALQPEGGC
nr:ribonuclease H-like domain-containing protein [Tanacetum cinerariifolium]